MSREYKETFQQARGVPGAVYAWESPGRILVLTGADIPDDPAADIVVTAWQFREALRQAGKLAEAETAIATMSAQRQLLFATSAVFGRSWPAVVNLKNKMTSMNSDAFDALFLSASLLQPEVVR